MYIQMLLQRKDPKMEIKYTISEAEYAEYLKLHYEKRSKKPWNVFLTLVLTALPVGLFVLCAVRRLFTGWALAALGAVALVFAAANFLLRTRYWKLSASSAPILQEIKKQGPDFWKTHRLSCTREGVRLTGGSYAAEYRWESFGGFEELGGMLMPIFNAEPLDLIPAAKLAPYGGEAAFRADFLALAKEGIRAGFAEKAQAAEERGAVCSLRYRYTKESYLRDLRDAARKRYTTRLILTKSNAAKLSLIAVLAYAFFHTASPSLKILYVLLALVLGYEHISVFTPLFTRRMETMLRPLLALEPERDVRLFLDDGGVTILGDIHYIEIPMAEIAEIEKTSHAAALYLRSGSVIPVPAPEGDRAEFELFYSRIKAIVLSRR